MRDGETGTISDPGTASEAAPQPVVEWTPPTETSGDAPTLTSDGRVQQVMRLFQPRNVGIASFLLGFPGGFGLVARNAWWIGARRTAVLQLVAGAVILLLILVLPIPRALGVAINFGIAYALYVIVRRQVAGVTARGGRVESAPGIAGLATIIGGWAVVAAPAMVLVVALGFLGGQVSSILAGTMEFGTTGSECSVDTAVTTTAASAPLHYVAHLSREVKPGETIKLALSEQATGHIEDDQLPASTAVDCVFGTIPGGTLPAGSYTFEFTVGTEQVATGSVRLTQ